MEDNKDVDGLYEELAKTLAKESEGEKPQVASDQNSNDNPSPAVDDENAEMSEDEISKLSPRAQKRIRELADKVKELAEPKEEPEEEPEEPQEPETKQSFNNVKDFLQAVEDEPSRILLEKFYGVIKGEMSSTLAPIEQKNNEARFEQEFATYSTIEGLDGYKNDLRKTFLRNPNQPIKTLVGEVVTDLQLNKIKRIESTPSTPNRGKQDISKLSKEELYDLLESNRNY